MPSHGEGGLERLREAVRARYGIDPAKPDTPEETKEPDAGQQPEEGSGESGLSLGDPEELRRPPIAY